MNLLCICDGQGCQGKLGTLQIEVKHEQEGKQATISLCCVCFTNCTDAQFSRLRDSFHDTKAEFNITIQFDVCADGERRFLQKVRSKRWQLL